MILPAIPTLDAGDLKAFIATAAGDIRADAAAIARIPGAPALEEWALDQLQALLAARFSPTVVALAMANLRAQIGPAPAVIGAAEPA